jgi:thiol-disulfide isomerase/thioredoxin
MQITVLIKNFLEKWKTPLLIVTAIVFFAVVAKFAMDYYAKKQSEKALTDLANNQERTNDALVYLFAADWCKYCKKAAPVWDAFVNQYNNTMHNNRRIVCNKIDCTDVTNDSNNELMKQFGVTSYPTILMIKDQKIIRYDASVSKENLDEFVRKMV